jgi:hypothetical protein
LSRSCGWLPNGLLRQYLPRRLDFRTLTHADLDAIAQELNERPRQTLKFKTPSQALAEALQMTPELAGMSGRPVGGTFNGVVADQ